jgi:flagellar basal-body rod modification protein FlgD
MSNISTTSAVTGPTSGAVGAAAAAEPSIGDRFLTLLVTQMRNQDPLNPMDNSQMTSQLAQISTVTGISKLNDTMSALGAALGSNQYVQAAGLVGHNVLVPGTQMDLAAGAAAGGLDLAADADHVVVTISDASGRAIRQIDLAAQAAGTRTFKWDGLTDSGAAAADGKYTFSVKATAGGSDVAASTLMAGRVDGVVVGPSGSTQLQLGRLGRVDLAQVIEIQ